MATTNTTDFYRKPYLTTVTFALGLLLFLLPFFDIKCNNMTMAQVKGIDMATGGKPTVNKSMDDMQTGFGKPKDDNMETSVTAKTKNESRLFVTALAALVLGVIGLVLSLINRGRYPRSTMIVGALGAVALIGSWIEISSYIKSNAKPAAGDNVPSDYSSLMEISASPTFWFILCLFCFLASAFFSYQQNRLAAIGAAPPLTAPQVPVNNPGDQSQFPAAPMDDRELG